MSMHDKDSKWLQDQVDELDLGDEFFDAQEFAASCPADMDGALKLYNYLVNDPENAEDSPLIELFKKNKEKVLKGMIGFIEYCKENGDENYGEEEEEKMNESVIGEKEALAAITPDPKKLTTQFSVTGEPIQPQLSDKVFKHLYSWEELRQRTKDAAWLYDQCLEMLNKGEKIEEIEKTIMRLEDMIKKFAEFYRKRFEIKLGYLRTRLDELKNEAK